MEDIAQTGVLVAVSTVLGGLATKALDWFKEWRKSKLDEDKQDSESRIPTNDQAVRIYKDIVEGLQRDMLAIREDMHEQDERYLKAREENFALRAKVDHLEREGAALRARITELESRLVAR